MRRVARWKIILLLVLLVLAGWSLYPTLQLVGLSDDERAGMNPEELADAYASASCVVAPGPFETFGLVALEAAASGARVVACETAPAAALAGPGLHTFPPGDVRALLAAIRRARRSTADTTVAAGLALSHGWTRALDAELDELRELVG